MGVGDPAACGSPEPLGWLDQGDKGGFGERGVAFPADQFVDRLLGDHFFMH